MIKKMKNITGILLVVVLVMATILVTGCGEKDKGDIVEKDKSGNEETLPGIEKLDTVSIDGIEVNEEILRENDLTMINVFSTSCGPCMQELPEIAELSKEVKGTGVGVIAVLMDTDMDGKPDKNAGEIVKKSLGEKEKDLMVIYPDEDFGRNILSGITSIPYTFFVDKDGNRVGDPYIGARSKDLWQSAISDMEKEVKK